MSRVHSLARASHFRRNTTVFSVKLTLQPDYNDFVTVVYGIKMLSKFELKLVRELQAISMQYTGKCSDGLLLTISLQ